MAANLVGDRFWNFTPEGQPAWHGRGINTTEAASVRKALDRIGTIPIQLAPMRVGVPDPVHANKTMWVDASDRQIVRMPIKEDPQIRLFGTVGPEYMLIDPLTVADAWDDVVSRPVETLGFLYSGRDLFVTTRLPDYDIRGDKMLSYLLGYFPCRPLKSALLKQTDVRVVCGNTLAMALGISGSEFKIQHDADAPRRLREWLGAIYQPALRRQETIRDLFQTLATTGVASQAAVSYVLVKAFPTPPAPSAAPAGSKDEAERMKRFMQMMRNTVRAREECQRFFEDPTGLPGMETEAVRDKNFWRLWHVVTARANHYHGQGEHLTEDILFGNRSRWMAQALDACSEVIAGTADLSAA